MDDYKNHLFSYVPDHRIMTLSCGHVISSENLVAWPVARGSSGQEFEFTFERRNSNGVVRSLYYALTSRN